MKTKASKSKSSTTRTTILDNDIIRYCINNGVVAYPVYIARHDAWFIEVNNNGKKITYEKQIKRGPTLKGSECIEFIEKTYKHWYELINKTNGVD